MLFKRVISAPTRHGTLFAFKHLDVCYTYGLNQ